MKQKYLFFAILLLSGCSYTHTYNINSPFSYDETSKLLRKGSNTVKGQAFMRQANGGVVTCAGYDVNLIPVTDYSSERMQASYLSTLEGYNPAYSWNGYAINYIFIPDEAQYHQLMRTTTCDAQGNFKFKNVSKGDFFITAKVQWQVPGAYNSSYMQGGALMKKISVTEDGTTEVIISR